MDQKLPEQAPSYISVHVGSRGRYYWDIKVNLSPVFDTQACVNTIEEIDGKLRQAFPKNAADMNNASNFSKFDEE